MKKIYDARDEMEANFLKGLLEAEGIEAAVQGEANTGAFGSLTTLKGAGPSVWVNDQDVERAMPIIEDVKRKDQADADEE
ncbi:MAG: DUF2007 domain-containing protein [Tepidisphaeraceae bacterium]